MHFMHCAKTMQLSLRGECTQTASCAGPPLDEEELKKLDDMIARSRSTAASAVADYAAKNRPADATLADTSLVRAPINSHVLVP
jgi:hypothetical protein